MTTVRLLLNSPFSGANAFFALADARGLFRAADLDLRFTPGRGAYTAAARLMNEDFDLAYGDLNALIELAAENGADDLPIAVFAVHEHSPSTITVARGGGVIHNPADLAGHKLVGHASDVALRTFAAYARSAGLAAGAVEVLASEAGMRELLLGMLDGQTDGVFGYVTTHTAVLGGAGLPATKHLRFLPYRDVCPQLYGSVLMVAPGFARDFPAALTRLLQVVRDGITLAQAEPGASIAAVRERDPTVNRRIELKRWLGTLIGDMACPIGLRDGLGDVDDTRLAASIECLSGALGWARTPDAGRVFTRRFLESVGGP